MTVCVRLGGGVELEGGEITATIRQRSLTVYAVWLQVSVKLQAPGVWPEDLPADAPQRMADLVHRASGGWVACLMQQPQ